MNDASCITSRRRSIRSFQRVTLMVLMVIYRGGGGGGSDDGRRRSRHRGCRSSLVNGEMNARADRLYIIRCRKYIYREWRRRRRRGGFLFTPAQKTYTLIEL